MRKASTLRYPFLSAGLGLLLFVSFIAYYNHSITNDYNTAVMQLMPLLQAMQEQLPAIKLSAAHLPYMVVVETANRAATFEHIFTESGEYPYFCLLHPNMVGTVSMS
jgi:plastocyanin